MDRVLAVDPGPKAGWALAVDGAITESGIVDGKDVDKICTVIHSTKPDTVVVEATWGKFMMVCMCNWSVTAQVLGKEYREANVRSWQAYYGLRRDTKSGETKAKYKVRILAYANQLDNLSRHLDRPIKPDECDALLILFWYLATRPPEDRPMEE